MSVRRLLRFANLRQLFSYLLVFALLPIEVVRGQSSSTVVLTAAATPSAAEPNVTTASVTGSGFPTGTIAPSAVTVHLAPVTPAAGPPMVARVSAVTTLFGSSRRITFQVAPANPIINVQNPTNYKVSVSGTSSEGVSFSSSNTAALIINPPARVQSVSPAEALPAHTLSVSITGVFSNFFQGSTVASFGPDISVGGAAAGSFGPVKVVSATSAVAQIALNSKATPGVREVDMRTGSELAVLPNGFNVSGAQVLTKVSPNTGQQGQQNVSVVLTGQFTHFLQGTTTASFGAGITVASLTVSSATSATAVVNISATAAAGAHNVTVTTGAEVITLANGFTVTNGTPVLTQVSPNTGQQGQQNVSVALTGQFTHFVQGATTASFGAGISVASLTVSSATSATAVVNISATAAAGAHNVTVTTGAEVITLTNGFTVTNGTAVLAQVNPNTGQQGQQNLPVALTGQFTHFVQGTTTASFGAGITVVSLAVSSATSATALLNISAMAVAGARSVSLTTGGEVVALTNAFTVADRTPMLTRAIPNTGQQGQQNVSVALTSQFTHFLQGTSVASFGAGITVASLTVKSSTSAAAVLNISATASAGVRHVTVTTGAEVVTLVDGFTITAGTPVLTQVSPNTGHQAQQNLSVALTGQFTHFVQGTTTASFGGGVTVASLAVSSATSATAVLNISATAAAGARNVSLTTGGEVVTLTNGFTVENDTPALTQVSPKAGQQQNVISLPAGTLTFDNPPPGLTPNDFQQGSPVGASSRLTNQFENLGVIFSTSGGAPYAALIDLTGQAPSGTNGIGAVNSAGNVDYTQDLDILMVVPGTTTPAVTDFVSIQGDEIPIAGDVIFSAYDIGGNLLASGSQPDTKGGLYSLSAPGIHEFRLHSTSGTVAYDNLSFDVPAAPSALSVVLTGQFTHFVQGVTTASFGPGVNVTSLTVTSATSATAVLNVSAAAAIGARDVTVTTGAEVVTLKNGFTVIEGAPLLTRVTPNMGQQGQQNVPVALTGEFTHFVQGTTTASFGAGIAVASLTVNSPTSATAVLNISAAAAGVHNVTVTTGPEVVALTNVFIVTNATALLTQVSPNIGQQGQQNVSVTLTGEFTHFVQTITTASFGAGISVASLTVNSPTSATAMLNISAAAAAGVRDITVTTAAEVVALTGGFTVTSGTPALTQVSPKMGQQGQQNVSVAWTGQFTHFVQGTTTASFGAGIAVASLTVNSATSATAVLTISAAAAASPRDVSVTTGAEIVTLAGSFTVTKPTPVLIQVSPNTGQQGQQTLSVALTGLLTHFVQGTTTASFGAGISVVSLTVTSATSATAVLNINATAVVGAVNVTLTTGAEVASLANGFAVTAGLPALTGINPNSGQQGQSKLSTTIKGQFTHFTAASVVTFTGVEISAGSPISVTSTSLTVPVSIASNAAVGTRGIQVKSGTEVVSLANAFAVGSSSSAPLITSVTPGSALPAQSVQVTITGRNTHFVQGTTNANFGPGVIVGSGMAGASGPVTVINSTTATAQLNIPANAALGSRTVYVSTGNEQSSLVNGFSVNGKPALISATPWSGQQGKTLSVKIAGAFTSFQPGVTVASFGAGISVGGAAAGAAGPVTVTSATSAVAQIAIAANAAVGSRTLAVTTGTQQESLSGAFDVLGPVTGAPPSVTITSPSEGSTITTLTNVTGTVSSPNLANWILEYSSSGADGFIQFADGAGSTVTGSFDPTLLLNGMATIRLTAMDQSGQSTSTSVDVVLTRNAKVGNFTVTFTDLAIPVAGLPIQVNRTYDSRNKMQGDFGFGWNLSYNTVTVQVNGIMGSNWSGASSGGFFPTYCVSPPANFVVSVRLQNGTVYQFAPVASGDTQCQQLVPPESLDIAFVPIGQTPSTAALSAPGGTGLLISGSFPGTLQLLDFDTGLPFDPDQFVLTMPNGEQLQLSRTFGLQSVTDTKGNSLTFNAAGITSSTGKVVSFNRDSSGRITAITDPNQNVLNYTYSSTGDLATSADALKSTSTYSYDSVHDLLTYANPLGVQGVRNAYDDSGHLIQVTDALGHVTNFGNDPVSRTESITDAMGNPTTYGYDATGDLLSATDALGQTFTATYDANGNRLTSHSSSGLISTNAYDLANNLLSETDALGNTFSYTYNSFGQVLTTTDPLGHITTNTYDAAGNLISTKDANGNVTSKSYNAQGKPLTSTDALGQITSYQYDVDGYLTQQTDPAGVATMFTNDANGNRLSSSVRRTKSDGTEETLLTQFQYDAANNLLITANPDGSTITNTYDALNKKIAVKDALGLLTQYVYDASVRQIQTVYPDGSTVSTSYDANGNRLATTDRGGHTTSYQYDADNQLTVKEFADGTKVTMAYDAMGRIVQNLDSLGNVTKFAFDSAGRQISVTNALRQTTSMAYDADGNQIYQTDAKNNVTQYVYDAVGRRTKVIYPDSTSEITTYDANGQIISVTDQAGKATLHSYDKLGRLLDTKDASGQVTSYTYDEVGNRLSQTDASGRQTFYSYDAMGRRVSRTLPLGQKETYTYDAGGNVISKTDFNSRVTTYSYDSSYRLINKTADPFFTGARLGAAQVSFTYTADGLRASMVDGTGATTYTYDALHRLTEEAAPLGTLSYAYDASGNEAYVRSDHNGGANTSYAYDTLNRLQSATDVSGVSTYTFDAVGNTLSLTYPNGVQTSFSYDSQNRLTSISSAKNNGALSEYNYTLESAGHRTAVQELAGRKVAYGYDSLYRLTDETISGAIAQNGNISYTIDKTGNRTRTASGVAAIPANLANYDSNDRLTTDTYDSAGNTTGSGGSTYSYDFENHLVQSGGVTITYDGDGNRVSKTVNGVKTSYLVDTQSPSRYPQVLEELQGGVVVRTYSYGLQLLNERQIVNGSSVTTFYGFDGAGNVRFLLDTNGLITDTYTYDAFGNMLTSTGSTPNLYRFSGQQFDPDLNLYYNRARYLDPHTGRFRTMDEYEGDGIDPRSLHKYLYADGNPVSFSDPSGHFIGSNYFWGRTVHEKIGENYEETTEPNGCSDSQVIFLVQSPPFGPANCGRLFRFRSALGGDRPDLAYPVVRGANGGGEIFEIKSFLSVSYAVVEVPYYLSNLRVFDSRTSMPPGWHWHPGEASDYIYSGLNPIWLSGGLAEAWVQPPIVGVILYYVNDGLTLDLAALAAATAILARNAIANAAASAAAAAVRTIGQILAAGNRAIAAEATEGALID
jgi:RHS repeat-associated protein